MGGGGAGGSGGGATGGFLMYDPVQIIIQGFPYDGTANTGGGGGGSGMDYDTRYGGAGYQVGTAGGGGSGLVIIRYARSLVGG